MIALKYLSIVYLLSLMTLSCKEPLPVDNMWEKEFVNAKEIVDTYKSVKKSLGRGDKEQHTLNSCYYIWNCGEYMFKCRGKNEDIAMLPQHAGKISFDDSVVMKFMESHNAERFADHCFTLQAMQRGSSFDESRDGLTITVFYPIRGLNENDYYKLREVFACNNKELHEAFLKKLIHPLNNGGCNKELIEVRDIIEKNVADSKLKNEVLELFNKFASVMPGAAAPNVAFKDADGNSHTIADFRGKVLVMDVWATWCGSCLKNMPKYMEFRELYKENKEIEFVTVSTDSEEVKDRWLAAIKKHKMEGMLNLTPDRKAAEQFEEKYNVSGVPRYIVIDKQGYIVSAFAPKPGEVLSRIIKEELED